MTAFVIALCGVLSIAVLGGCGGVPKAARTALSVTAAGVVTTDAMTAPMRAAKASECRDSEETAAEYSYCMETFDALEIVLRSSRRALYSTEAALDAWDDGEGEGTWLATVPCLAASLTQLLVLLEELGVNLPDELQQGVSLVSAFGGQCR